MADISKVQFLDIQESYGCGESVTFRYRFVVDLLPNSKDWIGLYRVGWKLATDYVTYEWVTIPNHMTEGAEIESVCTFKDKLPEGDQDFFQICYVDFCGRVCGVSSPFQFLEDYDIVVIEETESMLVVDSKPLQLSGKYVKISSESYEDKPSSNQTELEELKRDLEIARKQMLEKDKKLNEMQSVSDQVSEQLSISKKTLSELTGRELTYQEKEKTMNGSIQELKNQLCVKAQELEVLKMDHSMVNDNLNVKQQIVDDLTRRCNRMSAELTQSKRICESLSSSEVKWKVTRAEYLNQIKLLQTSLSSEKLKSQQLSEKKEATTVEDGPPDVDGPGDEAGETANQSKSFATVEDVLSDQLGKGSDVLRDTSFRCDTCGLTFHQGASSQVIREHIQSHQSHQKLCPICVLPFDGSDAEFETHVSEHFAETLKLPDGRKICPMCKKLFSKETPQDVFEDHVEDHFHWETSDSYQYTHSL